MIRTNAKTFYNLKKTINKYKIKKNDISNKFIHFYSIIFKKNTKKNKEISFYKIFKRKNTSNFYDVIRKHIETYFNNEQ